MKKTLLAVLVGFLMTVLAAVPFVTGAPTLGTGNTSWLTPEEVEILGGIDYDNAWKHLGYLSSLGEKAAGTPAERMGQTYVYDEFKKMPLDEVWWETFPVEQWIHYGTTLKIVSNGDEDIPTVTYGSSPSVWGERDYVPYYFGNTNDGKTIVAELVDVGLGTKEVYDAIGEIDGKIALAHRDDNVQSWPDTVAREAQLHGAIAIAFYGYYWGADHPDGMKQDSMFSPMPAISISPRSAWHLQDLLEAGPVTLQIDGRADILSEAYSESVNVAAIMWGTTRANEYVIISGHIDTWWDGTDDDCSSVACVLEFARLFSEARASGLFTNERTLIFSSVGAEEVGGPAGTWFNWLVGSYEFVVKHPDIISNLAIELNMDGVSFSKAYGRYWAENTWETNVMFRSAVRDLGLTGLVGYYNPTYSWTDAWSFSAKGGGSAIQMMWSADYDIIYHTQIDNMEVQGDQLMPLVLKLHGLLAIRSVHALVLPLDLTATCDWAAGKLKADKMMVPAEEMNIEKASAALAKLRVQAVAANAYGKMLSDSYAAASTPEEKALIWDKANALNKAIIDARRIVTPWTVGEGGVMGSWDVFLRPDQHFNDLSYVNAAITALMRGQVKNAASALSNVYTMQWGKLFSEKTYQDEMDSMDQCFMYWGDDFDQQQAYVDVYGIYVGLKDGTMSKTTAITELTNIKSTQLVPWLEADLETLAWAWGDAASILDAGVP